MFFSILQECNRKSKTASESPEPFKPSLKMRIEMNEVNYKPIDSCINTQSSSIDLMKSTEKWNVPRLASQMVQARIKRINCPNIETNTLYQRRKIERGIQTRHRSKLRCTSDGHCFVKSPEFENIQWARNWCGTSCCGPCKIRRSQLSCFKALGIR